MKSLFWVLSLLAAIALVAWVWRRPSNRPLDLTGVTAATQKVVAEARKVVSAEMPEKPIAKPEGQDVYDAVCAALHQGMYAPSTTKFSVPGSDKEASVAAMGRNVYSVSGFFDSQNLLGARLRHTWNSYVQMHEGGICKLLYFTEDFVGENIQHFGSEEDAIRIANGKLTLAEEKAETVRLNEQAEAVQMRIELHKVAQSRIASDWKLPSTAKFSTLQAADDQWTVCWKIPGKSLWGGVVDVSGKGVG